MPLDENVLLRAEEAAEVLGMGRSKVFEMFRAHELPVVRIGRAVRVPRKALLAWIEDRTEAPEPDIAALLLRRGGR
jgi:excisionase family DNA binding protein